MAKMKICKHCGAEIAGSAKVCPKCGGKNKKPIYKRIWVWILVVLIALGAFGMAGNDSDTEKSREKGAKQEKQVEYTTITVDELAKALDDNPASASDKYKGKYLEVTGKLSNIDADGSYINLAPIDDESFSLSSVQCYIKNDDQLNKVKKMSNGQEVTVKGKITDVGEVLGYSLDIDDID